MVTKPIGMNDEVFELLMELKDVCMSFPQRERSLMTTEKSREKVVGKLKEYEMLEDEYEGRPRYQIEFDYIGLEGKRAITGLVIAIRGSYHEPDKAVHAMIDRLTSKEAQDCSQVATAFLSVLDSLRNQPADFGKDKAGGQYVYMAPFVSAENGVFTKFYSMFTKAHKKTIPIGQSSYDEGNAKGSPERLCFMRDIFLTYLINVEAYHKKSMNIFAQFKLAEMYQQIFDQVWATFAVSKAFKKGIEEEAQIEADVQNDLSRIDAEINEIREEDLKEKQKILGIFKSLAAHRVSKEETLKQIYDIYDRNNAPSFAKEVHRNMVTVYKKLDLIDKSLTLEAS